MTDNNKPQRGASLADASDDAQTAEMPDSVGTGILEMFEGILTRFMVMSPYAVLPLALWLMSTHCFRLFQALAYVSVVSPTPGCGKTRLLELVSLLGPESTANTTEASLFRMIESYEKDGVGPTLLLDEAEILRERSERAVYLRTQQSRRPASRNISGCTICGTHMLPAQLRPESIWQHSPIFSDTRASK